MAQILTAGEIASALEEFAPLPTQEKWDNSGLCIGSPQTPVSGVLLGFDCTPALIDEAVSKGAGMVITHHPLIYGGLKKISPEDPVGLAVLKAAAAGICVYACHTPADKAPGGVSRVMADKLSLVDVRPLEPDPGNEEVGLGAVGNLPVPMEVPRLVELVKEAFSVKCLRTSRPLEGKVSRIALCGGSGSSLIDRAMAEAAQVYICGDISYHHFFTPEGFMVMDIGHFEGEVEIVRVMYSLLTKKFPNFAVHITDELDNSNPVYYF